MTSSLIPSVLMSEVSNINKHLLEHGCVIVTGVLSPEECKEMQDGALAAMAEITKNMSVAFDSSDPSTWSALSNLLPLHGLIFQWYGTAHAPYMWALRQNPNVLRVFCEIYKCEPEDLLSSFDGVSIAAPAKRLPKTGTDKWFHVDNNPKDHGMDAHGNYHRDTVQSWITSNNVGANDATLKLIPRSHQLAKELYEKFKPESKGDFYILSEAELEYVKARGYEEVRVACPAGSMVLWDSRCIHQGARALVIHENPGLGHFRNIAYVCMAPRKKCGSEKELHKVLKKRVEAFETGRNTSHNPLRPKLFARGPRTYGRPMDNVTHIPPLPKEKLSSIGRRLVGYST